MGPFFFSIYIIFHLDYLWNTTRKRDILYIFFISVFFQSSTLYADIQPKIESIVHSHLIKYWYYGFEDKYNQNLQPSELKYISYNFLKRINETTENKPVQFAVLKEKINVLLIIMESFRAYDIGAYGSNLKLSPNFDKYAEKGIL